MVAVNRIDVRIMTGDEPGAGSDGKYYFGIGGREFRLDIPGSHDFQRSMDQIFTLGEGTNISDAGFNDPRAMQMQTENLPRYPKYIRFEPANVNDNWHLYNISATVNPGPGQVVFSALGGTPKIWLGDKMSKVFYFGMPT
jgi:hypothetical protein